jgi:uncharacterized protein YggE
MLRTLSLSPIGRLSIALAVFLALLATASLVAVRGGGRPSSAARLPGISPETVLAQGLPPGNATGPAQNVISVYGEGEATAAPDVAHLTLGVQTDGASAREALDKASSATAAVIDALKGLGIPEKDLQTAKINVTPVTSQPKPGDQTPPAVVGYRASNTLNVTIASIDKAGPAIDAAVSAGANVTGGVRFTVRDDAALRRTALDAAVRAARAKADTLAAAASLRVTGVQAIVEADGGAIPVAQRSLAAADAGSAVPVQPGELTLRTRVQVLYTFG